MVKKKDKKDKHDKIYLSAFAAVVYHYWSESQNYILAVYS